MRSAMARTPAPGDEANCGLAEAAGVECGDEETEGGDGDHDAARKAQESVEQLVGGVSGEAGGKGADAGRQPAGEAGDKGESYQLSV